MRRKLLFGMLAGAISVIVAGESLFSRSSSAQEPPGKAEPEKKPNDLFELLKKDLEKSKPVLPSLPPAKMEENFPPVVQTQAQGQPPASLVIPPPTPLPTPVIGPVPALPAPTADSLPSPTLPKMDDRKAAPIPAAPPIPGGMGNPNLAPLIAPPKEANIKPAIGTDSPALPPMAVPTSSVPPVEAKTVRVTNAMTLAKLKSSPWSVHVEIVDEQTILTVSVNKKHDFKVVCQHVDLQTAQNTLKATGKVKIDGDALQGNCDSLTIPLYEDRLVLDGSGELRIRKVSTSVGAETTPAFFELKGDKLNLRISDLNASKFIETSWRRNSEEPPSDDNTVVPMKAVTVKAWSPYGKLRETKLEHDGRPVYILEGGNGQPIAHIVTGSNKSLESYVGRFISVYGAAVEDTSFGAVLRVSHIAIP